MTDYERVIAVDPGGHTGLIIGRAPAGEAPTTFSVNQEPWEKAIDLIQRSLESGGVVRTTIVVERYTITQRTLKLSRQYEALYCIGGLLVFARMFGCDIVLQSPGEAKSLVTDERLKNLGWYDAVKGKEHARDALRHMVRWLVATKRLDAQELLGIECP